MGKRENRYMTGGGRRKTHLITKIYEKKLCPLLIKKCKYSLRKSKLKDLFMLLFGNHHNNYWFSQKSMGAKNGR